MATEDTEYIDDAVLQMMACNVRPFTKADIIEWGSTVLHIRLKNSQSFLARYEGKVIESIGANKKQCGAVLSQAGGMDRSAEKHTAEIL